MDKKLNIESLAVWSDIFLHPQVEDFHGGGLVNDGFLFARFVPCFAELFGGRGGRQSFIDEY